MFLQVASKADDASSLPLTLPTMAGMTAVRWLVAALLVWGLFTGTAYVLIPLLTDGWGNGVSFTIGLALIAICGALLLRFDPRSR